jgi:photosystem II stability/assembly factor-like uncharacterized protein
MTRRSFALTLAALTIVPAAACAKNDDSTPAPADAGTIEPTRDGGSDPDASDTDAGPQACAFDWCVVPLDGIGNVALNAIWGSGPNDVWVVGTRGFAAHYDGTRWEKRSPNTLLSLFTIWGSGPNDVWAGNSAKTLFHWNGSGWEEAHISAEDPREVLAIRGSDPENVLALLGLRDGISTECPNQWGGTSPFMCPAVFRLSRIDGGLAWRLASDEKLVCDNLLIDNQYCAALSGMWVGPDGEPWLVGESGRAVRPRGGTTPPVFSGALDETNSITTLEAVAGSSPSDVWAVGAAGSIRHFTGGSDWAAVPSPTNMHLRAVWPTSPTDAWAVGEGGVILHWDGTSWQAEQTPLAQRPRDLFSIWGTPNGDTWAAGDHVLLQHHAKDASKP